MKKIGVFLFGISFFVLEIFTFLYYANEGSDDVIDRFIKINRLTCLRKINHYVLLCDLGFVNYPQVEKTVLVSYCVAFISMQSFLGVLKMKRLQFVTTRLFRKLHDY